MTDIRKDFEEWARSTGYDPHQHDEQIHNAVWQGYQAGRAHDVDGLIAELMVATAISGASETTMQSVVDAISKHFGKE